MELHYQQKKAFWSIIRTKLVVLWLTAVGALTPHFLAETYAIDNAKTPNITNLYRLDANHLFCHELRYFRDIMKKMVAFFLTEQSIVKDGELIYLFILFCRFLFFVGLLMFLLWLLLFLFFRFPFVIWPPGFKQGLRNKPPAHLDKNYFRIVFQPRENCHNRNHGTTDKQKCKNWYCMLHCLQCRYHGAQKLENSHSSCTWRTDSRWLCPF